jgi:hypothetical protein
LVFWRRRVAKALTVFISTSCGSKPVVGNRRFVGTFKLGVVWELARNEATLPRPTPKAINLIVISTMEINTDMN